MKVLLVVVLGITAVCATDMPSPILKHLDDGAVEIFVKGVAGLKVTHIKYKVDGKQHVGYFHQEANGHWNHKSHNIGSNGNKKIKYTVYGESDGKIVSAKGIHHQEFQKEKMVPSPLVRRAGVVMRDDFSGNSLNQANWGYEISMYGGYFGNCIENFDKLANNNFVKNWEIQVYTNDILNVFQRNGNLYLKPTLTSDKFGEAFLTTDVMDVNRIWGPCTNADRYGCVREGKNGLLPPVMSGKLKSKHTIKFGKVTVRAKIPKGDWIWPAIWMLPSHDVYGGWPRSGEIDMMESRGNTVARDGSGQNHGVNKVSSTLHWGSDAGNNRFSMTTAEKDNGNLWSSDFHTYTLDWTAEHILIQVDGQTILNVPTPHESFWNYGHFTGQNIWASGSKSAPFDTPFYLILNVAIGGTNGFFPDEWTYNSPKPWKNTSPTENADFWNHRSNWLPSWHGDDVAMIIDYVEMIQY